MWNIYIFTQIVLLVLFIILRVFSPYIFLMNLIKILPIILNVLFIMGNRKWNFLKIALILTLIADFFFLLKDNVLYGIVFFILVQIFYLFYVTKLNKIILACSLFNFLLIIIFKEVFLIIEVFIYIFIFVINLIIIHKKVKEDEAWISFKYGLLFLLFCDLLILIQNVFELPLFYNNIVEIVEWIFYLNSQIILVSVIYFREKNKNT